MGQLRCSWQRYLSIVPPLWLQQLVSSRLSSTRALDWDVTPLAEVHPNAYLSVFLRFICVFYLMYFIRVCYASTPGLHAFCRAHGHEQNGAPLATVQRTPSHNAQCMSLSTTVEHMPQPCRTMNALACQTFCKVLFAVCQVTLCTARCTV